MDCQHNRAGDLLKIGNWKLTKSLNFLLWQRIIFHFEIFEMLLLCEVRKKTIKYSTLPLSTSQHSHERREYICIRLKKFEIRHPRWR